MGIFTPKDAVVTFASFIVCRVVPATQGTSRRGVPTFCAVCAIMWAAAFDARVRFVAVRACVSVVLTSGALWDLNIVHSRWFDVDDFVLYGR